MRWFACIITYPRPAGKDAFPEELRASRRKKTPVPVTQNKKKQPAAGLLLYFVQMERCQPSSLLPISQVTQAPRAARTRPMMSSGTEKPLRASAEYRMAKGEETIRPMMAA